jgi:hypothetical protein
MNHRRLTQEAMQEPIMPRIPGIMTERPMLSAAMLATAGIAGSWFIVTGMGEWPTWALFPAMLASVASLAATVVGLGILVVLALAPVIGSRDLEWHAEPLEVLGLPENVRIKCEELGFWTCEALTASIERSRFPWLELEVERAISRWRATTGRQQAEDS